jgi:hypothetical protein
MTGRRGQSHVVGVALLLGIAVIAMGALTAAVGVVVDSTAAQADADRVADDLDTALQPVRATGPTRGQVTFASGRLHRVDRTLEVRADGRTVDRIRVDALVFESGDRRVASLLGAVVRGRAGRAWLETTPPITADEDVIVVGAPRLGTDVGAVSGTGGVTATVRTDVSHDRRPLGDATVTLALETATPAAWERAFETLGATVTTRPGTPPTVEATFPGERTGHLVVHDLDAAVTADG